MTDLTSSTAPARDFTDLAILRGSLAAILVAYTLTALANVWSATGFGVTGLARPGALIDGAIASLLNPAALSLGVPFMGAMAVIGYFVMAAYKGDHTTFRAAAIIGARTAGVGIAIPLFFALLLTGGSILLQGGAVIIFLLPLIAIGAVAGLAGRLAAGSPTLTRDAPPAS